MNNWCICWFSCIPLNAELNPICHLLALLGGATIVVVSRLRVNTLFTFTITLLCFNPLHVSGVKHPSSGGTSSFWCELRAVVAVGTKTASVVPPEDGCLTPETCRGL